MERTASPGAVHQSLTDGIGATPLVRLDRVVAGIAAEVHVKAEYANPGGSVKDRAAFAMVTAAERDGRLRSGGTVVEGTSGNTGIGLAMVAARRGYRCVLVVPDRTAAEKIALLRAYGAEVVLTPGTVPQHDPRHVRRLAERIAAETPGGWLADQYTNPANPLVHQRTTGPEIWAQTGGRITHLVAGVGTGGTITGTARHLREVAGGRVRIVAADPATSRYSGGDGSPYTVEAVGHYLHPDTVDDEWPETYDPTVVDEFVRVADGDAVRLVRRVAREEGLLLGGSAGTALVAALQVAADLGAGDVVVAIAPDSGRAYLSKYFDDDWCARLGFVDAATGPLVRDVLPPAAPGLAVVPLGRRVGEVAAALPPGPDLRPVVADRQTTSADRASGDVVGSVSVSALRHAPADGSVADHLLEPLATIGIGESVAGALARVPDDGRPLLVLDDGRVVRSTSRHDLTRERR
ncbi:Cysteine synthase [Pseudonocardia dioxanivorans CB1190]|uniref:Cysteine synthase n=1 Tax=Pseudonocardia dioxanivorans (strain ATCC 55486 / DSM 44775 / JCM 13855 / CB1190) TaxID=675635 RepID=F4CSZ7_PSEUX|nr:pyridoxal-phosphate dependent enzyme [Pseudonocardia dioxanivorans]AEA25296.1 Cysteine synthase [Pseudonocardia dioxanivorans CB1190]